jgi:hypothetical protein
MNNVGVLLNFTTNMGYMSQSHQMFQYPKISWIFGKIWKRVTGSWNASDMGVNLL